MSDEQNAATLLEFRGMAIDPVTGEAMKITLRTITEGEERKTYSQTGWFFYLPSQILPQLGGNLDTSQGVEQVEPWGFAQEQSADKLAGLLAPSISEVAVVWQRDEINTRFPTSVAQISIVFIGENGHKESRNAGLIASEIARTGDQPHVLQETVDSVRYAFSQVQ